MALVLACAVSGLSSARSAATNVPTCLGKPATIVGSHAQDTIHGTPGDDVIVARGGPDEVYGGTGNDLICGNPGQFDGDVEGGGDRLYGGPGDDSLNGGHGNDTLFGGPGDDLLLGREGRDTLDDGDGADRAFDGRGDDEFDSGPGDDMMRGGPADEFPNKNSVSYAGATSGVTIDLAAGRVTSVDGVDVVERIGGAMGSPYDDVIRGGPGANHLSGGCGDDHVIGGGDDDVLHGNVDDGGECRPRTQTDDDVIRGGGGPDYILGEYSEFIGTDKVYGGSGDDALASGGGREHFNGGPGKDSFVAVGGDTRGHLEMDLAAHTYTFGRNTGRISHVEFIVGSGGDDVIAGDGGRNLLYGADGNDTLRGRGGDDDLRGDRWQQRTPGSEDRADGGSGTDTCYARGVMNCENPPSTPAAGSKRDGGVPLSRGAQGVALLGLVTLGAIGSWSVLARRRSRSGASG